MDKIVEKLTGQYNTLNFQFGSIHNPWLILLVAAILIASLALSWWGLRRFSSNRRKTLIFLPRSIMALSLFFLFLSPAIQLQQRIAEKGELTILVDNSLSMFTKGVSEDKSRLDKFKDYFNSYPEFFAELSKDFNLSYFTFSDTLKGELSNPFDKEIFPSQGRTDLVRVLLSLQDKMKDRPWRGVVLITDGSGQENSPSLKDLIRQYPVSIYTFGLGKLDIYKDLQIYELQADEFGFVNHPYVIKANIRASGFKGEKVPVILKENEQIITTKTLSIDKEKGAYTIEFELLPEKTGEFSYDLSVPVYPHESLTENNTRSFIVQIVKDKVRLLLLCGSPNWDYRFLRRTLKQNPNFELVAFTILRTPLDTIFVPQEELSLIKFPADQLFTTELHNFDLIIFHNFNYQPYFPVTYLENIKKAVVEEGKGFAMIGGELSFIGGGYTNTPIEEILPIELDRKEANFELGEFPMRLTDEGKRHPITSLGGNTQEAESLWAQLPTLYGYNLVSRGKPGSQVLGINPFRKNPFGQRAVLAVQNIGKGRSMAFTVDSSWMWNFLMVEKTGDNSLYHRFWQQAVRWLIKSPDLQLLKLFSFEKKYQLGEKVKIAVKTFNDDYSPATHPDLEAKLRTPSNKILTPEGILPSRIPGQTDIEILLDELGTYTLEVKYLQEGRVEARDSLRVEAVQPKPDLQEVESNWELVRYMAEQSGGRYVDIFLARGRPHLVISKEGIFKIVNQRDFPLHRSFIPYAILVALLGTEWAVRKWSGLP